MAYFLWNIKRAILLRPGLFLGAKSADTTGHLSNSIILPQFLQFGNMLNILYFLTLGAVTVTAQSMLKCNADNCLRAIKAGSFPDRPVSADCIAFFNYFATATITAIDITTISDTTTATTITVPVEAPPPDCKCKRGVPESAPIPAYASKCSGFVRYSSACACIGATLTAAPVTTTVIKTSTTVISATATATAISFVMQLQNVFPGYYIAQHPTNGLAAVEADISKRVKFYLQPDGVVKFGNGAPVRFVPYSSDAGAILVYDIEGEVSSPLKCQISGSQYLTCEHGPAGETGVLGIRHTPDGDLMVLGETLQALEALGAQIVTVKAVPIPTL
ncbi:hypothetical protein TWF225_000391 [Orbilia oligospora]|nr:hypothetical protein TWF225_000391 [Orbilia oligospora]KAF3254125.1 hypothetical protein TWF128_006254 [Orbilia oligospora]KAF3272047.1 hypothetical protein TWF217_003862 [Orbilia oligospora]KAF3297787.1 hypothetical protein TWF132_006184 [Orbilia oligospora]